MYFRVLIECRTLNVEGQDVELMIFSLQEVIYMKKRSKENTSDIVFKLTELMEQKGYSKNRLCVESGFRFETIQGYHKGTISRVDLYVLASFCRVLACNIQDIMEYVPK